MLNIKRFCLTVCRAGSHEAVVYGTGPGVGDVLLLLLVLAHLTAHPGLLLHLPQPHHLRPLVSVTEPLLQVPAVGVDPVEGVLQSQLVRGSHVCSILWYSSFLSHRWGRRDQRDNGRESQQQRPKKIPCRDLRHN